MNALIMKMWEWITGTLVTEGERGKLRIRNEKDF